MTMELGSWGAGEMGKEGAVRGEEREGMLALSGLVAALSEVFLDPESGVSLRLKALEPGLSPDLRKSVRALLSTPTRPEELGPEYVRLFLHGSGSQTVHPYESVSLYGRLMAPEVLADLKRLRSEAGLRPKAGLSIPPDHLSLELELLAYLLERAARGAQDGRWHQLALELLQTHLLPFAGAFCVRLESARPLPFYGAAASCLKAALAECERRLSVGDSGSGAGR
jgi:TorA maturation chaperone TorD